ncbi:NAD-dependent epimerase/dehydratase family protein [Paenarthrobacter nitroguajacolicus]|uniref:NAD-dependent epimerase/dehydratase family protein n=1 Tax=Paenarthrobacter nitroguajacolicus TaxID=211146 RepID=A0A558H8L5_PAENT|nr:NAD(P)H-binding protein [Paenarthrobacter nitroguajacolicus]TVU65467.1 NAD-dependent epimerase/dehydratase family protein [Paenarthrobacter nitroguajacolicus]
MTSLCVAGGTGQVGREVVRLALSAGHTVTVLSRHVPPSRSEKRHDGATYLAGDVTTGEGLAAAVAGADVVIDCLEGQFGKAQRQFADGGARLLAAAHLAGVRRAVALSIINCDLSTFSYYVSKADKERAYHAAELETAVVRATQFHGLVAMIFAAGAKVGLIPSFKGVKFQSISPVDVAGALLAVALTDPFPERHSVRTVGGPEVLTMRAMAEVWKAGTGMRGKIIELPLPGPMGAFLRAGHNLIPGQAAGTETFVSWLEKRRESL